jgi:hypothetical protein
MWLEDIQYSICHNKSYTICWRDSGAPESGWLLLFHSKYVRGFRLPVYLKFATDHWLKPFAASFSQFDSCQVSCSRSAGGSSYVPYQFTSSHMVINTRQEHQWNPTLAISKSRYNNSNIRTLIHFNIEERIVSLTNDLFDYLYQLRGLCCLNVWRGIPWGSI